MTSPASDNAVDEVFRVIARVRGDKPRQVKALREYQILAMLEQCGTGLHGLRDASMLSLGFAAALRRSELCYLRVGDVEKKVMKDSYFTYENQRLIDMEKDKK
ncbi:MAG: hypothetical protein OXF60_09960 [Gammaproteobacteria bacterium]|nr:hypothetical protein [Gammaproteobacteria bacterium]